MALAVDTKHLLNEVFPRYEYSLNASAGSLYRSGSQRRFHLHRVCVYAIVTHNISAYEQFDDHLGAFDPRQWAALDRQAEQGDDEDEVEVLHHLKQLAATATKPGVRPARPSGGVDSRAGTTTLVASAQSPTFTLCTQHRSLSSFRRISNERHICDFLVNESSNHIFGGRDISLDLLGLSRPKIVCTDAEFVDYYNVIRFEQLDFFDRFSQSPFFPSRPGKWRRKINPFHHISPRPDEEHATRAHDHPAPEAKRFRGVRYRADHNRWVAEMKPPKSKNKVSFGEFRSQTDAARVVDVAFQHYGRVLNFADSTPHILARLPLSAGLSAEEKLKVKIKWIKDILPTLQSSPPELGVTSSTLNPSTFDTNSSFRPLLAMGSSVILVGSDNADDAASQPQRDWLEALMFSGANMADEKETYGTADGSGEGPQSSTMLWSAETAIAHDLSNVFGMSAEHSGGTLPTVVNSQPIIDVGGSMSVDFSMVTPQFSLWSPGVFQVEGADGSWEQ